MYISLFIHTIVLFVDFLLILSEKQNISVLALPECLNTRTKVENYLKQQSIICKLHIFDR